ncbi:hypothetical protein QBC42DRAFT_274706 [Cladorrhinum samala]|uniref:Zn(2)-C6 fungal-type domain-containing protein n=1 Tax=Cladorrhinum samala TaxID=585594 RepID=A0AAV9HJU0_9PEZI|nr:hypothetical protein QBC42DRAFT_274706 [Cladorrhinum samala]
MAPYLALAVPVQSQLFARMSESPSPNASGAQGGQLAANQRRVSTPKVRTGCITCKTRHVKCDERKPTCFRCEKAGMKCAGYITNPEPRISRRAPKSAEHLRGTPRPLQTIRPALTPISVAEKDFIFSEFLRYSSVRNLSGYLHADYWARILLCEGTQEECIQHAILAIGALSQAMFLSSHQAPPSYHRHPRNADPRLLPRKPVMNAHHRAAIHHQNQAISICLQRTRESDGGLPARTLLTLTLLLVAYELLQGDMESADGLMTSGIRLLQDSLAMLREKPAPGGSYRGGHDVDLKEDMEYILPLLSAMSGQNNSPHPSHTDMLETGFPRIGQDSRVRFIYMWGAFHSRCTTFIIQAMHRTFGLNAVTPDGTLSQAQIHQEQARLCSILRQWQEIIAEYHAAASPDDSRATEELRLITLQHHANLICLAWSVDVTDSACDVFEPEFRQIVHIGNEFLRSPEPPSATAFIYSGGSVAGPLVLAVTKCRNREIRLEALRTLSNMAWRGGGWDAKVLVCLMGLLLLEEAGRDERGKIEAENRWRWTGAHQEADTRSVIGEYTKVLADDRGQGVRRYLTLHLDRWMSAGCEADQMKLLDDGASELAAGKLDCDLPVIYSSWEGLADYDQLE